MQSSPPETRASLILRLKNAEDVVAWNDFVAIYAPVIFRVACRHGFQVADARELDPRGFAFYFSSPAAMAACEDRGSFRAWLLKIARNEAVDMLTRRATRPLGKDGQDAERLLAELPDRAAISRPSSTSNTNKPFSNGPLLRFAIRCRKQLGSRFG